MSGILICLILVCAVILVTMLAYLVEYDKKVTDGWMAAILITVAFLIGLCLVAGVISSKPKYFYEGMRVEEEDIDFSEFIMTYDEEKNRYNLEKREK